MKSVWKFFVLFPQHFCKSEMISKKVLKLKKISKQEGENESV